VLTFQRKTARSGRFRFAVLNGQPALIAELPPRRTPSSGRVIGEAAPERSNASRELPRQAVAWIELDASGRVSALHFQTRRRKLAHLAWSELRWPNARQLPAAAWAAVKTPGPLRWMMRQ
jgi:hypothetical protein